MNYFPVLNASFPRSFYRNLVKKIFDIYDRHETSLRTLDHPLELLQLDQYLKN